MGCENCVTRVRNSLLSLNGVFAADVLLKLGMAEILFDGAKVSTAGLVEAVSRAGNDGRHNYRAEVIAA
jgi:copper chaperone CopZ